MSICPKVMLQMKQQQKYFPYLQLHFYKTFLQILFFLFIKKFYNFLNILFIFYAMQCLPAHIFLLNMEFEM